MTIAGASGHRFEAVLFDLDDTLISWEHAAEGWELFKRSRAAGVRAFLHGAGHAVPELEAFSAIMDREIAQLWTDVKVDFRAARIDEGLLRIAEAVGIAPAEIEVDALLRAYGWGPIPATRPHADARPTLEWLTQAGYRLALVTNAMQPMWMRDIELAWHDLLDPFPVRLSSFDAGHMKPHPTIFRRALDALGVEAERAVFVGDRPANDIAGANAVGMLSVLMRPDYLADRHDLDSLPPEQRPDHVIGRLGELPELLAGLGGLGGTDRISRDSRRSAVAIEIGLEHDDG